MEKKGQVWVETVIYTLIGLALIGLVLAIVTPRINQFQDRSAVEQSIDSLNILDAGINSILVAPGNKRVVDFSLKRGEIFFDVVNDEIIMVIDDSRVAYSEPGVPINIGRVTVLTEELENRNKITLTISYEHNLTFDGFDGGENKFSRASTPYRFSLENRDFQSSGVFVIDINEI